MIYLHDLHGAPGSTHRKKRVGRGIGGKGGKTAGRGTKGQGARDTIPVGFEGGQLPLTQRIPKLRGFHNPFRIAYTVVNFDRLLPLLEGGVTDITLEALVRAGLVRRGSLVKVCARGELLVPITIFAHGFSATAKERIESLGGSANLVPLPFRSGRPAPSGNALMNR
ncbi:MAG: 50S ribosomal protein L15 [Ferrimicrobium sp.]